MQARNRLLEEWYGKIKRGEIKLPRFQRAEAWDTQRIVSMMNTIIKNLPLGITLVLDVGEHEAFVSRYLSTAEPDQEGRVLEHLLDGQQRLTALWRVLNNNYDSHTFFVYVPVFADEEERQQGIDDATVVCRARYSQNGLRYPKWCDNPEDCLRRGMIPTQLLRPEDIQEEIDQWIAQATNSRRPVDLDELEAWFNWKKDVSDKIMHLRSTIRNYNLPHLSLPSWTPKDVALDVFINMNTNSKPLSQYDIIVAEVESVLGQSLPDRQRQMLEDYPALGRYGDLSRLILHTSALFQDKPPNQRGALEMDKTLMMNQWDKMAYGLNQMANLLAGEGVFDEQRLPTNAVLWVIAALYSAIPEAGDRRGWCERLLRKYMWRAFLTDRYESSAPTNAYADYVALRAVLLGEKGEEAVPIFDGQEYETAKAGQFAAAAWPKNATILGRAALAITLKLGALDLATKNVLGLTTSITGTTITSSPMLCSKRPV